jgi:hypothetical protein
MGVFGCLGSCSLDSRYIHGNGDVISQERTAEGFTGVVLDGVGNINIYFTDHYRVVVTTDSNIQDIVTIVVKDNALHIDEKNNSGISSTKLTIDIYMPEINIIDLKGVGNIDVGAGGTSDLEINLSGVGNISADHYQAQTGTVMLNGVGDIKIWATNSLTGSLSGVGNILYKGNPTKNIDVSGIGQVKQM